MKHHIFCTLAVFILVQSVAAAVPATGPTTAPTPADVALANYFRVETEALSGACLKDIHTAADWSAHKAEYRRQLAEMLGLDPMPEKTPLNAVVTGTLDHPQFTVEKLYFQSRPGLYVTANLYVPKGLKGPAPTVLYVCGHGNVKKDGVSYGSKVAMQHWPAWFARSGYVCLIIDTLELGEIEGHHHGTYRENMWWWHDRGYTPAGVEAWNSIRALDYLESRPDVDKTKLGVTGRSGGGAYSWWLAALDERVKVAVPTAGITDMHDHVVVGAVEGHCDCMFMVNTYRWDFGQVAALVAPRPLLIQNTDKDIIFPLEGVNHVHAQARDVYNLTAAAPKNLGLIITEGPHKDTQELQITAFKWFNRHFKAVEEPIELLATPLFQPEQLKVFKELPKDEINTHVHDTFVAQASTPKTPEDKADWEKMRNGWLKSLQEKSFGGWPAGAEAVTPKPVKSETSHGITLSAYDFVSQHDVVLRLYLMQQEKLEKPELAVLTLLDQSGWEGWLDENAGAFPESLGQPAKAEPASFESTRKMLLANKWVMAFVAPRGVGLTALPADEKKRTQIYRRYPLLGQTFQGMQVYDARRAIHAMRVIEQTSKTPLWLQAENQMAGVALYASLFEEHITRIDLTNLPKSHVDGPHLLNVLKTLDIPTTLAMAAERSRIVLYQKDESGSEYARSVSKKLEWGEKRIAIRKP